MSSFSKNVRRACAFISHAGECSPEIWQSIAKWLEQNSYIARHYQDPTNPTSQVEAREISVHRLKPCQAHICLIDVNYLRKTNCLLELFYSLAAHIPTAIIRIDPSSSEDAGFTSTFAKIAVLANSIHNISGESTQEGRVKRCESLLNWAKALAHDAPAYLQQVENLITLKWKISLEQAGSYDAKNWSRLKAGSLRTNLDAQLAFIKNRIIEVWVSPDDSKTKRSVLSIPYSGPYSIRKIPQMQSFRKIRRKRVLAVSSAHWSKIWQCTEHIDGVVFYVDAQVPEEYQSLFSYTHWHLQRPNCRPLWIQIADATGANPDPATLWASVTDTMDTVGSLDLPD